MKQTLSLITGMLITVITFAQPSEKQAPKGFDSLQQNMLYGNIDTIV